MTEQDEIWMQEAIKCAVTAAEKHEVPVGAVLVRDNKIIASGANHPIGSCDPSAHAEIVTLRAAAAIEKNYRLPNTTLYVTIEPCLMCLGAIIHARVARVVFGASEPKAGVLQSNPMLEMADFFNHQIAWEGGVCAEACSSLITDFFSRRRRGRKAIKRQSKNPFAD